MGKLTRRIRRLPRAVVDPQTEWTRAKLQALLVGGLVIALLMVAGGVWSAVSTVNASHHSANASAPSDSNSADRLADKPMGSAELDAAQPGPLSTGQTGTIKIPVPHTVGAANVPSGFPHTPEGAMAQLIAIDQSAIAPASVRTAQDVITQWAAPGGPTSQTWSGVGAVTSMLSAAGLPADGSGPLIVTVEPKMGLIKGSVGDDFVVPCIDLVITATINGDRPQSIAAADCQRMTWSGDRWIIGAGPEAAQAPSWWPGTAGSFDAGYLWLEVGS